MPCLTASTVTGGRFASLASWRVGGVSCVVLNRITFFFPGPSSVAGGSHEHRAALPHAWDALLSVHLRGVHRPPSEKCLPNTVPASLSGGSAPCVWVRVPRRTCHFPIVRRACAWPFPWIAVGSDRLFLPSSLSARRKGGCSFRKVCFY